MASPSKIPPLRHGDRLTREEFERRYEAMPDLKKAELIDGMVYLAAEVNGDYKRVPGIPPLENGDLLTLEEFFRRYEAMPHVKKAELIEGMVYMPSPVQYEEHGRPHFDLIGWLGFYKAHTPGVGGADNTTVRLDPKNGHQPDALLRITETCGGQSRIENRYIIGGPEWVGEVSFSSVSYDAHVKFEVYRRNNVQEYLLWRVEDNAIDWFRLRAGQYERLQADADGIVKSEVFPGLWLDVAAMLRGDMARVLEVVQQGVRSDEHEQFVRRLQQGATER